MRKNDRFSIYKVKSKWYNIGVVFSTVKSYPFLLEKEKTTVGFS